MKLPTERRENVDLRSRSGQLMQQKCKNEIGCLYWAWIRGVQVSNLYSSYVNIKSVAYISNFEVVSMRSDGYYFFFKEAAYEVEDIVQVFFYLL